MQQNYRRERPLLRPLDFFAERPPERLLPDFLLLDFLLLDFLLLDFPLPPLRLDLLPLRDLLLDFDAPRPDRPPDFELDFPLLRDLLFLLLLDLPRLELPPLDFFELRDLLDPPPPDELLLREEPPDRLPDLLLLEDDPPLR